MMKKDPLESKFGKNITFLNVFFHRILTISYSYPKSVIAAFFALLVLSGLGFNHFKLELDVYDVKDNFFVSSSNWFKLRHEFKDPNSLFFLWKPSNILDSQAHCRWQNLILKKRNEEMLITRVFQAYNLREPLDQNGDLLYQRIIEDPCQKEFSKASLDKLTRSFWGPVIIDKNQKSLVTEVSFEGDIDHDEVVDIKDIERVSNSLIKGNKEIDPKGEITFLGPLSYRLEFKRILAKDGILHLGLFVFIIIFFRIFLGTWKSGLIYTSATFLTFIYTLGLSFLLGYPMDILTNNLLLMTAIAGTADFIFLSLGFFKFDEKTSFYKIITPAFFTTFTTMVGFLSLYSSDLLIIKRFGISAAIGAFFEWSVLYVLFPSIRTILKSDKPWVNKEKALSLTRFKKILDYTPSRKVTYLFLAVSIAALFAWPHLNYSDSPKNNFPANHPLRITIESFKKNFGWEGNISLLFPRNVTDAEMKIVHQKISEHSLVQFIENKQDLLNSWTNKFESLPRKDLIIRDFESTPLVQRYESENYKRSVLYLKNINTKELETFQHFIQQVCKEKCFLSGQVLVYLELNKRVSYTMIESFLTSIILVLIILFTLMHILKVKGARFKDVVISSMVGPLFMMTVIAVIQVPVNVVTSIFFAALVGLTGDNAIQYLFAAEDKHLDAGIEERGDGSLMFAILLIFGSLFFVGQTLIPLKWLGFLFSLGFLINFIGDYWILKSLNKKRFQVPE
jgi:predicted RND superfamily exporter protein